MKNLKGLFSKVLVFFMLISIISQITMVKAAAKTLPSGLNYSELPREIEDYVNKHSDTTCGMNVIVYDSDEAIYENSFGYVDKEAKLKSELDSVYEWGSISKLFIWVSVMQLYEQDKIDLTEDIKKYLPDDFLKNLSFEKPITILDLMNHKAGFQDTYFIQTPNASDIKSLEEALQTRQPKQVYEPGEHTAYSNWSAALAAYIVQRISGMDYVDYVHKNIFEPLNMKHSSISPIYADNDWVRSERLKLKCYDTEGEIIDGVGMYYIHLYPAGSAAGTINDLKTFAQAIMPNEKNPSPLFKKQSTLEEIYKATSFYGSTKIPKNYHGFFASEYGVETIGHGGNTFGCSSMLQFDPKSGVGMVVMTNQAHETIYNYEMYELIYGKFTDSKFAKIKREVPKGLILNTRGILKGPLSFMGAMGVSSYSEEDLENWWYEEDGVVETQFSDFITSTPKAITNVLCMLFFIIAGIYGIVKLVVGGFIIDFLKNKKEGLKTKPLRKYSYILCGLMGITLINLVVIFIRLNKGYRTGDIGSVESYIIQSVVFTVLMILMAISIFVGMKKYNEESTKKEKHKFFITSLFAITQCLVILSFEMYKFWGF